MATWRACYDGFTNNLADALPLGKRVPADIGALMNEQEYAQTLRHLDQVYSKVGGEQLADAKATMDAHAAWLESTTKYVAQKNGMVNGIGGSVLTRTDSDAQFAANNPSSGRWLGPDLRSPHMAPPMK